MADNPKVSKRRWVDVENGNSLRLPEWNEIKTVQPAHDTNHVDVFLPVRSNTFIVGLDLLKLGERAILITVIRAIENIRRLVVVHLSIECSGCLCSHDLLSISLIALGKRLMPRSGHSGFQLDLFTSL